MKIQTIEDVTNRPLSRRSERAMRAACEGVIEAHIPSGRPIHIWRDGQVVEISAEELRAQRPATSKQ